MQFHSLALTIAVLSLMASGDVDPWHQARKVLFVCEKLNSFKFMLHIHKAFAMFTPKAV